MAVDLWGDKIVTHPAAIGQKKKKKSVGAGEGLTRLPDTLGSGQSVAEDPLVPQTSKTVDDIPALVQNRPLDLVLVGV